jgi:hypothetical protein
MSAAPTGVPALPTELLRLIFRDADLTTLWACRLSCRVFAEVGLEFLLPPHFTSIGWRRRRDLERLVGISEHPVLCKSIKTITFNFSELHGYNARHSSYFEYFAMEPEARNEILLDAWEEYFELEGRRAAAGEFQIPGEAFFRRVLRSFGNLTTVRVVFEECPYSSDVLKRVFRRKNCRVFRGEDAAAKISTILKALPGTSVSSFVCDYLPLAQPALQSRSFQHGYLGHFTSLKLTIDTSSPFNYFFEGLSPDLTSLSLAFQGFKSGNNTKAGFNEHRGFPFHFPGLTDLKLENIAVTEDTLFGVFERNRLTLRRLRLGGKGPMSWKDDFGGGITLTDGSLRSLFTRMRDTTPKALERLHLEGDFQDDGVEKEVYDFYPITDDEWNDVTEENEVRFRRIGEIDCLGFEDFVLRGGDYPYCLHQGFDDSQ